MTCTAQYDWTTKHSTMGSQANPAHYVQCCLSFDCIRLKKATRLCILEGLPPSSRAASISSTALLILASPVAQYSRCSCTSLRVFFLPVDRFESDVILFISAHSLLNSCTSKEGISWERKGWAGLSHMHGSCQRLVDDHYNYHMQQQLQSQPVLACS